MEDALPEVRSRIIQASLQLFHNFAIFLVHYTSPIMCKHHGYYAGMKYLSGYPLKPKWSGWARIDWSWVIGLDRETREQVLGYTSPNSLGMMFPLCQHQPQRF